MPTDLAAYALALLDELTALHPLRGPAKLEWRRFRTTAGRAVYDLREIHLSAIVLDSQDKVRDTLIHEYAHLLAYARAAKEGRGHGKAWQKAMEDLGGDPKRTHSYACRRNVPRRVVVYACSRCGALIVRHRRLARHRRWMHASCGGSIALMRVEAVQNEVGAKA